MPAITVPRIRPINRTRKIPPTLIRLRAETPEAELSSSYKKRLIISFPKPDYQELHTLVDIYQGIGKVCM